MTKWFFEYLFICRDHGDNRPMLAIFNAWEAATQL